MFVAAGTKHNSHGSACMDSSAFPTVDLVGGALGAIALVYTGVAEDSPGWLAIPGVFVLSGIIGAITVYRCNHPDQDKVGNGPARRPTPDAYDVPFTPPPDPPADPELRDATPEERGGLPYTPIAVPAPATTREPGSTATAPIPCRIHPLTECPTGSSCVLTDGESGVCRLDSEMVKPKTTLPP